MATLDTASKAPLIVTHEGTVVPITPGSITHTGDPCIGWSGLTGEGTIDVIGQSVGTTVITVSLVIGGELISGTLEVTVTEPNAGSGELVVTLGPSVPK